MDLVTPLAGGALLYLVLVYVLPFIALLAAATFVIQRTGRSTKTRCPHCKGRVSTEDPRCRPCGEPI